MIVPIFPLPNIVLFPKTVLPLQVFEESYRVVVKAALAGKGRIATALVRSGPLGDISDKPAVHEIACLGNIEKYEELEGGKFNVQLAGIRRVRLLEEVENAPYRLAKVVPVRDFHIDDQATEIVQRRNQLTALFTRFTELFTAGEYQASELVPQLDFEGLVNTVASTLNFPVQSKQTLLETDSVAARCDMLLPVLKQQLEALVIVRRFEEIKPRDPNLN